MAPPADPYRTLGLGRDATLDQVKRAYRRLAKANHPDTAGEAAVPRFLAIKAAYEAIAGPDATDASRGAGRKPSAGPRRAWEADPARADATRRAYGSRARGPRPGPRPAPGARPAGRQSPPPSPGSGGDPGPEVPDRPPNLATLGSTTYDSAEGQPFEPDWGGASWYGTTSGTYWTLNPKEYADPRKHGPEYQARARRARRAEADELAEATVTGAGEPTVDAGPATTDEDPPTTDDGPATPDAGAPAVDADPAGPSDDATGPTHTTTSWWDATAGATAEPTVVVEGQAAGPPRDELRDRFLDPGPGGVIARVGFAIAGWVPIAAGIGALASELSGCSRAAQTCSAADAPIASFAQIGILAVLLLVPLLARLAAMAALAVLVVAIPGSLVIGAFGQPTDTGSIPLVFVIALVAAWFIGLALAGLRESRRPPRPVS
jgi:DnaJ domain